MTGFLLAIWFVATFVVEWYARELNITFLGLLGFYRRQAADHLRGHHPVLRPLHNKLTLSTAF
jgi:hypothetical protein